VSDLLRAGRAGERPAGLAIIDMHAHLGVTNFTIPDLSARSIVASMDRLGVAQAVVSHMACMSADAERGNRKVRAALEAFPGRLLGYLSVWPFSRQWVGQQGEYWLAQPGFAGIKLHNSTGFPYTHEAYEPLYALANDRRLPVLLHTWGAEEEFAQVRALAERYPEAAFLLAHSGSTNEAAYLEIARDHPHVYLDTTLSMARRGLLERLVEGAGAEKVVWGSDIYFLNQAQQLGKVLGAKLGEEVKGRVLGQNARAILNRVRT
jgi:predicted TIM-barrel fold metal-dependent hydrolase